MKIDFLLEDIIEKNISDKKLPILIVGDNAKYFVNNIDIDKYDYDIYMGRKATSDNYGRYNIIDCDEDPIKTKIYYHKKWRLM